MDEISRIESELEVRSYLQNLKYALQNGAKITFQEQRLVDKERDERFTNRFTVADLFPDEDPVTALRKAFFTSPLPFFYRETSKAQMEFQHNEKT